MKRHTLAALIALAATTIQVSTRLALAHEPQMAVLGTQEFAALAPEDVRPGALIASGTLSRADDDSFTFAIKSSWGTFTYDVTRESAYPMGRAAPTLIANAGRVQSARGTANTKFADLASLDGKSLTLVGVLDGIDNQGEALAGVFPFAGEHVRLTLILEKRVDAGPQPPPTIRHIAYGPHWRQTIDFYSANTDAPAPLLVYIHGGGWVGGDKSTVAGYGVSQYLDRGVSVAAVNYRRVPDAVEFAVNPPVQYPLHDAARAIQVLRHMAGELNIDKTRLAAAGGSAGACTSLWLAMHDDLADPASDDAIARESTRLACAAVLGAQTVLDPVQLREWMPNMSYGSHAFGIVPRDDRGESFQKFWERRDELLPQIKLYSPYEQASSDDPPIYLQYSEQPTPAVVGTEQRDPTHSAIMGIKLKERLDSLGVPCELKVLAKPPANNALLAEYVISKLKAK